MNDNKSKTQENQETVIMAVRHDSEALIAKAIDKKVPVETMERLLIMRRELKWNGLNQNLTKPWQYSKPNAQLLKKRRASEPTPGN